MKKINVIFLIIILTLFITSCQKNQDISPGDTQEERPEVTATEVPEISETSTEEETSTPAQSSSIDGFELQRAQGKLAMCEACLKNLATALEMYSADYEGAYPASLDILTQNQPTTYNGGGYIRSLPECPSGGKYIYEPAEKDGIITDYKIYCSGNNHSQVGVPENYPAYSSEEGIIYPEGITINEPDYKKNPTHMLTDCEANLRHIATALEMCAIDREDFTYPPTLEEIAPYLTPKKIPVCPAAGEDTYSASYKVSEDRKSYILYCSGHHHKDKGISENYPQYSPPEGLKVNP